MAQLRSFRKLGQFAQAAAIENAAKLFPFFRWAMRRRESVAGDRGQRRVQLADRRLHARSDVVLPLPLGVRGSEVRGDDIIDVDEVARLRAVAVDGRLL